MRQYMIGIGVFGYLPILYAVVYYCKDVWIYLTSDDEEELESVQYWRVSVLNRFYKTPDFPTMYYILLISSVYLFTITGECNVNAD